MPDGTPTRADRLVALAGPAIRKLTGTDLTPAEEKFLRAVAEGRLADFSAEREEDNDPANASQWKNDRVLRAPCIAWLCTDPDAARLLTHCGILVRGVRIDEELQLLFARIDFPLVFSKCAFVARIDLRQAELHSLMLAGTHSAGISGDFLRVKGNVYLREDFKTNGEVRLLGASIGGDLDCTSGQFSNPRQNAFSADGVKVNGSIFLRHGFKAHGEARFVGASVGRDFDCSGGQFSNPDKIALSADGAKIEGGVSLWLGFKAKGEVRLLGASIGQGLNCDNGFFSNPGKHALNADGVRVEGPVRLCGGFKSEGEVRLLGAFISKDLSCTNGEFLNPGKEALSADGAKIEGSVYLCGGFRAEGAVRLLYVTIGRILDCTEGQLSNSGKDALGADGAKIEGSVFMRDGFKADGKICLNSAEIGGHFQWQGVQNPEMATLELRSARVNTLWDEKASWPPKGQLYLQGFVYNELCHIAPAGAEDRIDWLNRNNEDAEELPEGATQSEKRAFFAQPYQQLASVLRNAGQEDEADEILIEKNKRVAKWTRFGTASWWWYCVFGRVVSYGYRPLETFLRSLIVILAGTCLFELGYQASLISPTSKDAYEERNGKPSSVIREDYPRFNSIIYSTEMFVPLVKLYQAEHWLPNANRGTVIFQHGRMMLTSGGLLRGWLWFETGAGWFLTTIWVAGLTGVIKKAG